MRLSMNLIQAHPGKKKTGAYLGSLSRTSVHEIKGNISLLSGSRIFEFPRKCQTSVLTVPWMQACDE